MPVVGVVHRRGTRQGALDDPGNALRADDGAGMTDAIVVPWPLEHPRRGLRWAEAFTARLGTALPRG